MAESGPPRISSFEGYSVGQTLTLNVCPGHGRDLGSQIRVRVRELHTRTLSCTIIVDVVDGDILPSPAFLKLFDRRFSDQLRSEWKVDAWTPEREQTYVQGARDGAVDDFLGKFHADDAEEDWDDVEDEAFLDDELFKLFTAEVATYDALREQQGKTVPELLAAVNLDLDPGPDTTTNVKLKPQTPDSLDFHPFQVKGILLQYIDGHTLRDVPKHYPRSTWQEIADEAVSITRLMGDYNILNKDIRLDNYIVTCTPDGHDGRPYRVYMIDFGLCRVRGEDETDFEWGRDKCNRDEEGACGLVFRMILRRDYGFELEYEPEGRYDEWADTDESLPEGTVRWRWRLVNGRL